MDDQASNKEANVTTSNTSRTTMKKPKCCKISINKPLIPLKLALFFYYGEFHTSFSYFLLWVAVIEHSHYIAPEGLTSTVIAVAGGIHYSSGKSTSGLIGGMVMNKFGAIVAFRLLASICLSMAVLYTCYRILRNRCSSKKNLEDKKERESKEEVKSQVVFTLQEKT